MITYEKLVEARNIQAGIIQTIFDPKCIQSFKEKVLHDIGWKHNEYDIERCHGAMNYRLTLKHDDGREKDLYIDSNTVHSWLETIGFVKR